MSVSLCNAGNGRKFTRSNVLLRVNFVLRKETSGRIQVLLLFLEIMRLGKCTNSMTGKHLVLQNLAHLSVCVDLDN